MTLPRSMTIVSGVAAIVFVAALLFSQHRRVAREQRTFGPATAEVEATSGSQREPGVNPSIDTQDASRISRMVEFDNLVDHAVDDASLRPVAAGMSRLELLGSHPGSRQLSSLPGALQQTRSLYGAVATTGYDALPGPGAVIAVDRVGFPWFETEATLMPPSGKRDASSRQGIGPFRPRPDANGSVGGSPEGQVRTPPPSYYPEGKLGGTNGSTAGAGRLWTGGPRTRGAAQGFGGGASDDFFRPTPKNFDPQGSSEGFGGNAGGSTQHWKPGPWVGGAAAGFGGGASDDFFRPTPKNFDPQGSSEGFGGRNDKNTKHWKPGPWVGGDAAGSGNGSSDLMVRPPPKIIDPQGDTQGPGGDNGGADLMWRNRRMKGYADSEDSGLAEGSLLTRKEFVEGPFAVGYGRDYMGEEFMSYCRELGVYRTKLYMYWHWIEPQNNVYDFSIIDAALDQLRVKEEVLFTVYTSSNWGAEGIGDGFPPRDYDEYFSFVYNLVEHCEGRVKYWQRDPEPGTPGNWDVNRPEEYVLTQKRFYNAVKQADPEAIVIGGGHSGYFIGDQPGSLDFYDNFFYKAEDYFDMVDVRIYRELYSIPMRIKWFKDKMFEYGYQKPIVATEYGGPHPCQFLGYDEVQSVLYDFVTGQGNPEFMLEAWIHLFRIRETLEPEMQMFFADAEPFLDAKRDRIHNRDIVQRTLLLLSSGVDIIWYWMLYSRWDLELGPHPLFGKLRLTDLENEKRLPAFYVYQKMIQKLTGVQAVEQIDADNPEIFLYQIRLQDAEDIFVVWERRTPWEGEDLPSIPFTWYFPWKKVSATDLFGRYEALETGVNGRVTVLITDTPLFLERIDGNELTQR